MAISLLNDELSLSTQKAEEWKAIPGYEGLYEASDFGKIRTVEGKTTSSARFQTRVWKQRIMKFKTSTNKYGRKDYRVSLWKDGVCTDYLVARLVASAWCAGFSENMTVNHINGNPLDNRAENLEWCSRKENIRKAYDSGLYKNVYKPVTLTDLESGETFKFCSSADACRFLERSEKYVSGIKSRNGKTARSNAGKKYYVHFG